LGEKGMLVACGRRHGLVASVTRLVSFGPLDPTERSAYTRLLEVERAFLDASVVGARLGDVVRAGTAAYREHGFDAQEWHRHHQGGFSGFQPREFPASPESDDPVPEGCVLAWNPSGGGWKVEDTTLVDDSGPDPLVHDDAWPTVTVGGRLRPDVLVL
jgi:Xaa-Pro aminopeptidase